MTTKDLKQLAEQVADVITAKRNVLLGEYGAVSSYSEKADFAANVVTTLDLEIENYLRSELKLLLPTAMFVGEENGGSTSASLYWLVDPIDGTSHYVRGLPFCTSMIALVQDDEVILSVIYNFVSDELFMATRGGGAFMNGTPIHVSNRPIHKSLISYDINLSIPENVRYFTELCAKTGGLFNSINCGYELSMIACGRLDGKVFLSPYAKRWDIAAGSLLIHEAGGFVRNFDKQDFSLSNSDFYASNPVVANAIDDLFRSL